MTAAITHGIDPRQLPDALKIEDITIQDGKLSIHLACYSSELYEYLLSHDVSVVVHADPAIGRDWLSD